MADFREVASSPSSDDEQHGIDEEGGPAWETAPDNDDEDGSSDDDDASSERSKDHGGTDGDFEDAWLDDYLPDSPDTPIPLLNLPSSESAEPSEDVSRQHLGGVIKHGERDDANASHSASWRSSLALEVDTIPSLVVVDGAGEAVVSVSSPRLAGLAALKGSNPYSDRMRKLSDSSNSEPSSPVPVHPMPTFLPVEKSTRRDSSPIASLTPLSPSTSPYKRASSVFAAPATTMAKIMLAQQPNSDSLRPGLSRPRSYSQVWDSTETTKKTSSRLLDEWKRKEMWQDLKRAEENVVAPNNGSKQENSSPSRSRKYKRASSDARLDTLLQTLQAEVSAKPAERKESRHLFRRQSSAQVSSSAMSPVNESDRDLGSLSRRTRSSVAISNPGTFSSSALTLASVPVVSPPSPVPSVPSAPSVSLLEFERVQQEKEKMRAEMEKARDDSNADQERLRYLNEKRHELNEKMAQLNEKQHQLEAVERENRSLREETQKNEMQALSSNELVKTLRDQLTLTSKSEEQLKLQTKQLMEQNQSLQSDLLEKIASETTKFQKMARLSAENESLMEELERKENTMSERELEERQRMRGLIIHRLLRSKTRDMLQAAVFQWLGEARRMTADRTQALTLLCSVDHGRVLKLKAKAFNQLKHFGNANDHADTARKLHEDLDAAKTETRLHCVLLGLMHLDRLADHWERRQAAKAFCTWKKAQRDYTDLAQSLELGLSKLQLVLLAHNKMTARRTLSRWQFATTRDNNHENIERVQQLEGNLAEAKECVFSLSRAKTKLEEKLQACRDEAQRLTGELTESSSELQLVKHGFVTTVIRDTERAWLRTMLVQWRIQTHVYVVTKELRLQVEMAELKAAERDKYSKSLDDYSRVLRSDLERFQFFSLDKRITVDVLSKKLLREEERYRHMEERHVALEEKAHALKSQLTSFVEWDGLALPFSVLALCKDAAVSNLRELFLVHAAADSAVIGDESTTRNVNGETPSPRLAMFSVVRLLEYSTLVEEKVIEREVLAERLAKHLPPYAVERGLLFADFITGLNQFVTECFASSNTKHEQLKRFWSSLFGASHVRGGVTTGGTGSTGGKSVSGTSESDTGSSWAGHLSDDILQNQEKLLAVLEHETAVVERAVMEKASLKHAYPASDHTPSGSVTRVGSGGSSTFFDYQCDPLLPPEPANRAGTSPGTASTPVNFSSTAQISSDVATNPQTAASAFSMDAYANWHLAPQVRDIFLAFHSPLLKLLVQYTGEQRTPVLGNQYCLNSTAVFHMLADLKLHPTFLSQNAVQAIFNRFCESGNAGTGLLAPQGFTLFLGSCALDLYSRSLADSQRKPEFQLSAREVLLSFFSDLGLIAESELPPATRLCFVGIEIEAILWPLFEYYSTSVEDTSNNSSAPTVSEDTRIGMTAATFERFMADIAGKGASESRAIFRRVKQETCEHRRRQPAEIAADDERCWRMRLDEFYVAISCIQTERSPGTMYTTPGEAVRQWLQQTQ